MISINLLKRVLTSLILLPILIFSIFFNKYFFLLFLTVVGIISSVEWYSMHKNKNFLLFASGCLFLIISIFSAFSLRGNNFESVIFITWILFVCFFSDIGGYVFGKTIGGKKLTRFSPNKTIAGSLGSIIFSFLPILIISSQHYFLTTLKIDLKYLFLSFLISVVCQFGDIFISYFKRLRNMKDSGYLLPGHGGLLDRIDGVIFVLPFVFFLKIIEFI